MSYAAENLRLLTRLRDAAKSEAEAITRRVQAAGHDRLTAGEEQELAECLQTRDGLDERIADAKAEVARSGDGNPLVNKLRQKTGTQNRAVPSLTFAESELRAAYEALSHGSTYRLEARGFSTADSLLPPQLWQLPVGPVHEPRLMNFLPAITMDAPSLEFIVHTSTTGVPAVVAEGASKPELVFGTDKDVIKAIKVAAHNATSYEVMNDFPAFTSYVQSELIRQVIEVENSCLINGDGTGAIVGFLATDNILNYEAGTFGGGTETSLDSIELAIALMRTGTAKAEPDLLVLTPDDVECHPTRKGLLRQVSGQRRPITGRGLQDLGDHRVGEHPDRDRHRAAAGQRRQYQQPNCRHRVVGLRRDSRWAHAQGRMER